MSCWFLAYNTQIRMHISPPSGTSLPPTRIPSLQAITEHQTGLPVLNSSFQKIKKNSFPLAILRVVVYICQRCSSGSPSLLPISVPTRVPSMSASLFLPCKSVPRYHFSRFHINVLIYGICFFFLFYSTRDAKFTHLILTDSNLFLFIVEKYLATTSLGLHLSMDI